MGGAVEAVSTFRIQKFTSKEKSQLLAVLSTAVAWKSVCIHSLVRKCQIETARYDSGPKISAVNVRIERALESLGQGMHSRLC